MNVTVSGVAVKDAGHGLGEGTARRAAAISGALAGIGWAGPAVTASVSGPGRLLGDADLLADDPARLPAQHQARAGDESAGAVTATGSTTSFE